MMFFSEDGDHRDIHVLTHAYPKRRASVHGSSSMSQATVAPISSASPMKVSTSRSTTATAHSRHPSSGSTTSGTWRAARSEEHTSALQSLMRISYAVFCLTYTSYIFYNLSSVHRLDLRSSVPPSEVL